MCTWNAIILWLCHCRILLLTWLLTAATLQMNQPAAVEKLQVELGMYILVVTVGPFTTFSLVFYVKLLAFVSGTYRSVPQIRPPLLQP